MRLVVGLGNPGERYRLTRHNAGFRAVDALAARVGCSPVPSPAEAWVADVRLGDEAVRLVKPLSYMNRSGEPLRRLLEEQGGGPGDLVVLVDDVVLELGTVRVRERGSHGGHNGLRSIAEALGTSDFPRVRIGVREPGLALDDLPGDLADYVLAEFPAALEGTVADAVALAADAALCLLREGAAAAMNRFNGRST